MISKIENLIVNENFNYSIYDKYTCSQNIDRIKFYTNESKNKDIKAISAGYHLNKETQKKTGGLFFFNISPSSSNKIVPIESETILVDYGILDIKFSKNNLLIFTANSDYSYSIFNLTAEKQNQQNKNYLIDLTKEEDINKKEITNDIIEINQNETKIFSGANDGNIFIHDIPSNKNILTIPNAHEYGIWSMHLLDEEGNTFLSGAEDAQIKMWDIRCPNKEKIKEIKNNNKSYQSSINYIDNLKCDCSKNILITGSYDEKILFFDLRYFPKELKCIKTEHSVWDVKQCQLKGENLLFMASIYEGFNIWNIDTSNDINMTHILRLPVTKDKDIFHKTIVYGVDIDNKENKENSVNIVSCSFYDNLIMYWNYSHK